MDDVKIRMHSWEYISSGLLEHFYIKILFYMRDYPFIGK